MVNIRGFCLSFSLSFLLVLHFSFVESALISEIEKKCLNVLYRIQSLKSLSMVSLVCVERIDVLCFFYCALSTRDFV